MFKVGDFEACGAEFHGEVVRLGLQGQGVRFGFEAGRAGSNASVALIYIGQVEIGAAWQ